MKNLATLSFMIAVLIFAAVSLAEVPQLVNYQGRLTAAGGGPVPDAAYLLRFTIWNDPVGATAVNEKWTSGSRWVNTVDGQFSYDLGSNVQLPHDLFFGDTIRYLGIKVGSDPEILPRTHLVTVPYAYHALRADTAGVGGGWVDDGTVVRLATSDDFVGIGRSTAINSNEILGLSKNTVSWGGMNINTTGATGKPFYGYAIGGAIEAYHYFDGSDDSWRLFKSGGTRLVIDSDNRFGIGTVAPVAKIHVVDTDTLTGYLTGTYDGALATILKVEYVGPNTSNYDATAIRAIANQNIYSEYGIGGHFEGGYIGLRAKGYSIGVLGTGIDDNGTTIGVQGTTTTTNIGTAYGVLASANGTEDAYIYGLYASASGTTTGDKYAGYFNGAVEVTGTLSKGGGSFKIDHPLDPENKYLQHSFVESPDMMNVYNGNVSLDANGEATIQLPDYFDALNMDFRYQLTCIGNFAPVYVADKIAGNQFNIAGGSAYMEVSWQVTGVRKDKWAEANRIEVEVDKSEREIGTYIHPEAYGQPVERHVNYEQMQDGLVHSRSNGSSQND